MTANNGKELTEPTLSRIIKQFKGSITKSIGFTIWQKSYYDRIIRNENEYFNIRKYIKENALKWEEDELKAGN